MFPSDDVIMYLSGQIRFRAGTDISRHVYNGSASSYDHKLKSALKCNSRYFMGREWNWSKIVI